MGEYDDKLLTEFKKIYTRVAAFISDEFGTVSSFEHGKLGQTVFHSHVHLLPFPGAAADIIPEGEKYLRSVKGIAEVQKIYGEDGGYLFFSIGEEKWTVKPSLTKPRFFRDRFAQALGKPERGNWKEMQSNEKLMNEAHRENREVKKLWDKYIH